MTLKHLFLFIIGAIGTALHYYMGLHNVVGGYITPFLFAILLVFFKAGFKKPYVYKLDEDENIELNEGIIFIFVYAGVSMALYHLGIIRG